MGREEDTTGMRDSDRFIVVPHPVVSMGPQALAVYAALRMRADSDTMECWPSIQRIADDCGMSVSTVRRARAALRDGGWIDWRERKTAAGQSSHVYRVYGSGRPPATETAPPVPQTPSPLSQGHPPLSQGHPELITKELQPVELDNVASDDAPEPGIAALAAMFAARLDALNVRHRYGKGGSSDRLWHRDLRLMRDRDGRDEQEIAGAIQWALREDCWWASVVHSPAKLRKHYDRMRLQATSEQRAKPTRAADLMEAARMMDEGAAR